MGSLKKKPKPFSDMPMVCGVQSSRILVVISLLLVLIGCLVLYMAMQNEEWTHDEPCQKKVFLVAFLLLVTSVALCYYALNGDFEEEKERSGSLVRLTSVKYGDYCTLTPDSLVSYQQYSYPISNSIEEAYLKRLHSNGDKKKTKKRDAVIEDGSVKQDKSDKLESNTIPSVFKIGETRHWTQRDVTNQSSEVKTKSLIVELMPELPLQLCEKELGLTNSIQLGKNVKISSINSKLIADLPNQYVKDEQNSDAG